MIIGILIAVLSLGFLQEANAQQRYRNHYRRQQRMERIVVRTPGARVIITEPRYRAHYPARVAYRGYAYRYPRYDAPRYRRHARWDNSRYSYNRPCRNPYRDGDRRGDRW